MNAAKEPPLPVVRSNRHGPLPWPLRLKRRHAERACCNRIHSAFLLRHRAFGPAVFHQHSRGTSTTPPRLMAASAAIASKVPPTHCRTLVGARMPSRTAAKNAWCS